MAEGVSLYDVFRFSPCFVFQKQDNSVLPKYFMKYKLQAVRVTETLKSTEKEVLGFSLNQKLSCLWASVIFYFHTKHKIPWQAVMINSAHSTFMLNHNRVKSFSTTISIHSYWHLVFQVETTPHKHTHTKPPKQQVNKKNQRSWTPKNAFWWF